MQLLAARWFHAASAIYFLSMDVLYALKLLEVLSARTDLLWAHYRGLGLQFFTVWSQVRLIFKVCVLGCDALQSGRQIPIFQRNLPPPRVYFLLL
jgi:hypothetical protein